MGRATRLFAALALAGCTPATTPIDPEGAVDMPIGSAASDSACEVPPRHRFFIEEALRIWGFTVKSLALDDRTLPRMVFFDTSCAFWVGGRDGAEVRGVRNEGGMLQLPGGERVEPDPRAAAALDDNDEPYFAMALMPIWEALPAAADDPALAERMLTVATHEMLHTVQLPGLAKTLRALGTRVTLPERLTDNLIEETFSKDEAYTKAFADEVALLYRAFEAPDAADKRTLVSESLAMARARREQYLSPRPALVELEPLFLALEGPGEWIRFKWLTEVKSQRPAGGAEAEPKFHGYERFQAMTAVEVVAFIRGKSPSWSQDHGLAICLVLDQLLPDWHAQLIGENADPYQLLERAAAR